MFFVLGVGSEVFVSQFTVFTMFTISVCRVAGKFLSCALVSFFLNCMLLFYVKCNL